MKQIKELQENNELLIYNEHHRGLNPRMKTIRGLIDLASMEIAQILSLSKVASKDLIHQQQYSKLILSGSEDLLRCLLLLKQELKLLEADIITRQEKVKK